MPTCTFAHLQVLILASYLKVHEMYLPQISVTSRQRISHSIARFFKILHMQLLSIMLRLTNSKANVHEHYCCIHKLYVCP